MIISKKKKLEKLKKILKKDDIIFDIPFIEYQKKIVKKFSHKEKLQKYIWDTTIPTSSITIKKKLLNQFINLKLLDNYDLLEIDFRINVLVKLLKKKIIFLEPGLTYYCQTPNSIMSNYSKIQSVWWKKRIMAHDYFKKISKFSKQNYLRPLDFYISVIIYKVLKIITLKN